MSPNVNDTRFRDDRGIRIFLSHRGLDGPAALDLNLRLRRGFMLRNLPPPQIFNTSWHEYRFTPGWKRWLSDDEELREYLREHLWACDAYLLLLTWGVQDQPWIMWEMREARQRSAVLPPDRQFFFPCLAGPKPDEIDSDLADEFFSQYELYDLHPAAKGLNRLVDALTSLARPQATARPSGP